MAKPPWYTVGFDEARFLERAGPSSTEYQRHWLAGKFDQWDWNKYRRQAGVGGVSDTLLAYRTVVNSLTKAQASRIIDSIVDLDAPVSIIDLFDPDK